MTPACIISSLCTSHGVHLPVFACVVARDLSLFNRTRADFSRFGGRDALGSRGAAVSQSLRLANVLYRVLRVENSHPTRLDLSLVLE